MPETVLFLSGDLMFASRVRAAAQNAGYEFSLSGNIPDHTDAVIRHVVVDLSTRSKVVEGLPQRVAAVAPDAKLIAYGPHVQIERLKAARAAGIETVLTRGQFDAALGSLFASS